MNRKLILDLIIEHNMELKWLQDKLQEADLAQAIDNEIARRMKEKADEWNKAGNLGQIRQAYKEMLKAVREEVEAEVKA